jgi:hypothetical protein
MSPLVDIFGYLSVLLRVLPKTAILLMPLSPGTMNFLTIGRLGRRGATDALRLERFAEVEIGLGLTVLIAAAFGLFEWAVRTGRLKRPACALVFPISTAFLLGHSHRRQVVAADGGDAHPDRASGLGRELVALARAAARGPRGARGEPGLAHLLSARGPDPLLLSQDLTRRGLPSRP